MAIKVVSKSKKTLNVLGKSLIKTCRRYIELSATFNGFLSSLHRRKKLYGVLLHDQQNTFIRLSSVYLVLSLENPSI